MTAGALSSLFAVAVAFVGGFLVTLIWTLRLHRRHGIRESRTAILPASFGGLLGAFSAMAIHTMDRQEFLGL